MLRPEFKVVTLLRRKPGMSREDFIRHYESRHAVLATRVIPGLIDYRRMYLDPGRSAFGVPADAPGFDVITTLVFADAQAYERAFAAFSEPEVIQQISADEADLFDRSSIRAYVVEEHQSELP